MGYDYVAFGDFHFKDDLQYEDAVPMLARLMKVCEERKLGVWCQDHKYVSRRCEAE